MACETGALLPPSVPAKVAREVSRVLDVEVTVGLLASSTVVGSLAAGNANGAVVTNMASDRELAALRRFRPAVLDDRLNAVGNNVLCNERGAVVNPEYGDEAVRAIAAILGVPVERGTVAGVKTVGSAAVANSRGALCHPHITPRERTVLEEALCVPVATSTANFGTPQVGACLLATSRGAVAGARTTPIELGRIEEGLGLG
jgi:translation initiation factor 6